MPQLTLGDQPFRHRIAQRFDGFDQRSVKVEKAGILPDPNPGDADFAGKIAFVLGLAGFDHTGVFFGPKDGIPVGLGRFGADPAGLVGRLAFADDGNDAVVPFSLLCHKRGEVP